MRRKKVYLAHAGGTIGMRRSPSGWAPAPGFLEHLLARLPVFRDPAMPEYTVGEFDPLLDSADMEPGDWVRIARDVERHVDGCDGIVVLHGTDTMAYTASALAFMLEDLPKPVVLTGSTLPMVEPRTDATHNLITSMLLAAGEDIPEVGLFFDQHLFRGCRAVKSDCVGFAAFASPNLPPLATAGLTIEINEALVRWPQGRARRHLKVHERMDRHVGVLWLFPGITADIVRNFLAPPLKGAVVLAFGVGNGPTRDPAFLAALRAAADRGVVLVAATQCWRGTVDLRGYATGAEMAAAGLVSGYDMTPEAALTKLAYLLGKGLEPDAVRARMGTDLRGELTSPGRRG